MFSFLASEVPNHPVPRYTTLTNLLFSNLCMKRLYTVPFSSWGFHERDMSRLYLAPTEVACPELSHPLWDISWRSLFIWYKQILENLNICSVKNKLRGWCVLCYHFPFVHTCPIPIMKNREGPGFDTNIFAAYLLAFRGTMASLFHLDMSQYSWRGLVCLLWNKPLLTTQC